MSENQPVQNCEVFLQVVEEKLKRFVTVRELALYAAPVIATAGFALGYLQFFRTDDLPRIVKAEAKNFIDEYFQGDEAKKNVNDAFNALVTGNSETALSKRTQTSDQTAGSSVQSDSQDLPPVSSSIKPTEMQVGVAILPHKTRETGNTWSEIDTVSVRFDPQFKETPKIFLSMLSMETYANLPGATYGISVVDQNESGFKIQFRGAYYKSFANARVQWLAIGHALGEQN